MVQPIHPWSPLPQDPAIPSPPGHTPAPRRDISEIPDAPGDHTSALQRFVQAHTAASDRSTATSVGSVSGSPSVAQIQARLDGFLASASPMYRTPEGNVRVAAPFRINGGYPNLESVVAGHEGTLRAVANRIGMPDSAVALVKQGRGSPDQVRQLTQGLIDAGCLPPPSRGSLGTRIRQMMFDFGVGFDCAGYVRQAFSAAHPTAAVAWRSASNEDLSGLGQRGLTRTTVDDARPGDVLVLKPPAPRQYGHTAVIYDSRGPTVADRKRLDDAAKKTASGAIAEVAGSAALHILIVDSSFGSFGTARRGGVERQMWVHDQVSGRWLSLEADDEADHVSLSEVFPYGHPVDGGYRAPSGS
jgi:hypothetical protein